MVIMMKFIGYPKCTTCRKAKAYLDSRGVSYELRDIRQEHPTYDELQSWLTVSGLPVKRFFNTGGLLYKALALKEKLPNMTREECLELLATDGMLVKRPLLIGDGVVRIGFRETDWESAVQMAQMRVV
jgi:arsenate reductase